MKFKQLFVGLLASLSLSLPAHASGICSKELVSTLETVLKAQQDRAASYAANTLEVLLVEKSVFEAKYCLDADDYESFLALARNLRRRIEITKETVTLGAAPSELVSVLLAEKVGLIHACGLLQPSAAKRFAAGVLNSTAVKKLETACAELSK